MTDWLGLQGKICVVTGGGGGIGRATGVGFAEVGAAGVALLDNNLANAEESAAQVRAKGVRAIAVQCDIADAASVRAAADRVAAELGVADVLVNNAGILRAGSLATIAEADWHALMNVNLTGYLLCAQAFGAGMRERGRGALVHIASIAATNPQPWSGAYSVSKAGVHMLSRQLAYEWGPHGVRSNVVSPAMVRTPMSESFYTTPGVTEARSALAPLRAISYPTDIANAVVFLSSQRASYITGQEILVDGGVSHALMGLMPRPGFEQGGNA
jgi:NAD(P)-dependent dehydrogenase (short-subunit alcohol dehydrogenase family)